MSSSGRILAITPLLPWRPAILSPSAILRVCATQTRTSRFTPGGNSSLLALLKAFTSMILPRCPCGTLNEVSLTSRAFSPKIALSSFSSALSSVSPFGVIFPTRMSAGPISALHSNDPLFVEIPQALFPNIRNVSRYLFGAQLRVPWLQLHAVRCGSM